MQSPEEKLNEMRSTIRGFIRSCGHLTCATEIVEQYNRCAPDNEAEVEQIYQRIRGIYGKEDL